MVNRCCKGEENQTFVVEIKCRKNHTWQGTINWIQEQKTVPFRSALELLKLMDSAITTEEETESDEW